MRAALAPRQWRARDRPGNDYVADSDQDHPQRIELPATVELGVELVAVSCIRDEDCEEEKLERQQTGRRADAPGCTSPHTGAVAEEQRGGIR